MASRTPTKRSTKRTATRTPAPAKKRAAAAPTDLAPVFAALKRVLAPYARRMAVKHDAPEIYYLESTAANRYGEEVFFGAVRTGKRAVAYHLMPMYVFPALSKGLSPALKKRMKGKACFQFTAVDAALFKELSALTKLGFEEFKRGGVFGK